MKKEKENELALAELGDKLIAEKVSLEAELKGADIQIKRLERKLQTAKLKDKNFNLNTQFAVERKRSLIRARLEKINKELNEK